MYSPNSKQNLCKVWVNINKIMPSCSADPPVLLITRDYITDSSSESAVSSNSHPFPLQQPLSFSLLQPPPFLPPSVAYKDSFARVGSQCKCVPVVFSHQHSWDTKQLGYTMSPRGLFLPRIHPLDACRLGNGLYQTWASALLYSQLSWFHKAFWVMLSFWVLIQMSPSQ